jgi:Complex I intermediate-associated protein 30 (CIA30)
VTLGIDHGDEKTYTFIIKDETSAPVERGQRQGERATVNWEVDFRLSKAGDAEGEGSVIFMPWTDFRPTYRGRELGGEGKVMDTAHIGSFSLMMRR